MSEEKELSAKSRRPKAKREHATSAILVWELRFRRPRSTYVNLFLQRTHVTLTYLVCLVYGKLQGTYVDKKCPFTGNVAIRGRIIKGLVLSTKMKRTIIVRRDYLQFVKKYRRFEKRHRNIPAHVSPAFTVKEGDIVTIGQCRFFSTAHACTHCHNNNLLRFQHCWTNSRCRCARINSQMPSIHRPLSKTVRFNVLSVEPGTSIKSVRKQFRMF